MSKPNFQITDKETGKEYWISRSVIVVPFVFNIINNEIYTIIEKRGKAVSSTGKWCCPCGYIDWDETLEEACSREVKEETGLNISPKEFKFNSYNSDYKKGSAVQNVSFRFACFISTSLEVNMSKIQTKEEIDDLKWIKVGTLRRKDYYNYVSSQYASYDYLEIDKKSLNDSNIKWAFDHNHLIIEVLKNHYKDLDLIIR